MSDLKRENDLRSQQIAPAHPLSPIEREAIKNASTGPVGTIHEIGGEITRDTIKKVLDGHKVSSND